MSVKAAKAKNKSRVTALNQKRAKTKEELEFEAEMIRIENDPNATPMAKALAPLMRERQERAISGEEPYLTIEQIQEELGRG